MKALHKTFPALDGVRAISILWVILLHLPVLVPDWVAPIRRRGELGVELFFSISGFLVTRSLFQCMAKSDSKLKIAQDFLLRRVSRIFPPYFLILTVLFLSALIFDSNSWNKLMGIKDILWVFPGFLSNYFIPFSKNPVPETLGITWSLAFEEQFYLGLLLMFFLGGARKLTLFILGAGFISVLSRYYLTAVAASPMPIHDWQMLTHLRFDALAWSCLSWIFFEQVGWLWANRQRALFVNIFIVLGTLLSISGHHLYPENPAWQSMIYALTAPFFTLSVRALCETQYEKTWIVKFLSSTFFSTIGIVSYEIYLIHQIGFSLFLRLGIKSHPLLYTVLIYGFSIGGAWIFHRWFSLPTQRWLRGKTAVMR